ncbi:MAG: hypothetical protein NDF54_00375 [archaeon GB-1867-035]|nr:hypothetical protein [Candidatus Culexmicrobium profundum]
MSKKGKKSRRKLKVFFLAVFLLIALAMSLFFLQPLNVISVKAEYIGAHIHFIGGSPYICLIFKVKNPRATGVTATVEIDLSDLGVPTSRVLTILDDTTGNRVNYTVKGTYKISLVIDLSSNEVRKFHVVLKQS